MFGHPPFDRFRQERPNQRATRRSQAGARFNGPQDLRSFAQDFTVFGGSCRGTHAQKINKVQEMAMPPRRAASSGLQEFRAARAIQEGVSPALAGYTVGLPEQYPRLWRIPQDQR